jgi:transcriptional antiterminator NusG
MNDEKAQAAGAEPPPPPGGDGLEAPPPAEAERHDEAVAAAPAPAPAEDKKRWYVVKVQSGREETIKDSIERRVKIEGLEDYFGQIVVPVERVTEVVKGKRVVRTRKLYPGYLMVNVEFNDRILYLFRETGGVGDFVGAGPNKAPPPMSEQEVQRMLGQRPEAVSTAAPTPKIKFDRGDHVKIKEGTFAGMEGDVSDILEAKGLVRVMLKIFGRDVPVELEYWQIEHT